MTPVGEKEIETQRRVVALFRDGLGYRYLGDWRDRDGNRNVESRILASFLKRGGHTANVIAKAIAKLDQAAALGAHELARIRETALQPRRGRLGRWEERLEVQLRAQVDVALCHLASDAGLRRSEAARLEWSDFTEWDDGSGRLRIAPSKGHDEQVVYITPFATAYLRDLRMMQGVLDDGAPWI